MSNTINRWISLLPLCCTAACADELSDRMQDRAAIERVYYNHRLGQKPPFEETLPPSTLQKLVRLDLKKEAVLLKAYRVSLTPAIIEAEVQRINHTSRAPEMLAEIKDALGNDQARFAQAFAKPFLVERLLRDKFDNDDALHAATRRETEQTRAGLLAARTNGAGATQLLALLKRSGSNTVTETTWQLAPRPAATNVPAADELEIKRRFGPDAQLLAAAGEAGKDRKWYFEDLPQELQNVLNAQLRRPGDVSAVVEMPGGFLLYLALEKTDWTLGVAILSLPKRSYEQWLQQQSIPEYGPAPPAP
jgi:hypothetical protein